MRCGRGRVPARPRYALPQIASTAFCCYLLELCVPSDGVVDSFAHAPCGDFLRQLSEEFSGLSFDVLSRFAEASRDAAPEDISDRLPVLAARDIVDAQLRFATAGRAHLCRLAGCDRCPSENSRPSDVSALTHLSRALLRFAALLETAGASVDAPLVLASEAERIRVAVRVATTKGQDEFSAGDSGKKPGQEQRGSQALFEAAPGFMSVVGKFHGAVISSLNVLASLAATLRASGDAERANLASLLTAYLRGKEDHVTLDGNGESLTWPLGVELSARNMIRPFSRASILCDPDRERLYRQGSWQASMALAAVPFRDASGSYSWHGRPALELLRSFLDASGVRPSRTFLVIRPEAMYHKGVACSDAHGILYDPTLCLEEAGWSGDALYLRRDVMDADAAAMRVRRERRPETAARAHKAEEQWSAWPVAPPSVPIDVLFIHPMAGNCELIKTIIVESGSPVRLIYVPVNPTLPPPLRTAPDFGQHYDSVMAWGQESVQNGSASVDEWIYQAMTYHYLAQCSLAQVAEMLWSRSYDLVQVEHMYAVFVQRRLSSYSFSSEVSSTALDLSGLFEHWRLGWYCSPLASTLLELESTSGQEVQLLGIGELPVAEANSVAQAVECSFLASHGLAPNQDLLEVDCSRVQPRSLHAEAPSAQLSAGDDLIALRGRSQWAEEMQAPLPGVSFHLEAGNVSGHCLTPPNGDVVCECFTPFRGPRCDERDPARTKGARDRGYKAAVNYIVNEHPVHIAELLHALRNLWKHFNHRYDYPVIVFHDGLSPATRLRIVRAAPHRVWFHWVPWDFLPDESELPVDLKPDRDGGKASHHSFSVGYRAQSRFRAGPIFAHPAIKRLDYLWGLDTDSQLPRELESDPFEEMHRNSSLALAYRYLTVTSATSSKNFWEYTLLFLAHMGVDIVQAHAEKRQFLSKFLVVPGGTFETAPAWNNRVVMTDCEIMRVSLFVPGTMYYRYFEFLDAVGGFWHHRWGDHAVRGLGAALALWPHAVDACTDASCRTGGEARSRTAMAAYELKIPYAHQESCFCESKRLRCVSLGRAAAADPQWPLKKKLWGCEEKPPAAATSAARS